MEVSETLQCNNKEKETEDDESLIEKCWEEQYKGESRKWLIRDASAKMPLGPLSSTMKESYRYPYIEKDEENKIGKRKAILLKKFYEDASNEIIKERASLQEPNDYCTEYDGNFNGEGFKPEDQFYIKNTELYQKYPLYSSAPVSYYSFNFQKNPKEILHGLTKVGNPTNLFNKNASFTKPLSECLDNDILVACNYKPLLGYYKTTRNTFLRHTLAIKSVDNVNIE